MTPFGWLVACVEADGAAGMCPASFDFGGAIGIWYYTKLFIERMIGFSHDALHVLIGVCLQLLLAAVFRTSLRHPGPWLGTFAFATANEAADIWMEVWHGFLAQQLGEAAKDLLLTMFLPTLLLLTARFRPRLLWSERADALTEDAQAETIGQD